MRTIILTVILVFAGMTIACTSAGADKRMVASADSVYCAEPVGPVFETAAGTVHNDTSCRTFTIAMTGDIMMGTTYPKAVLPANSGKSLFKDVRAILRNADLAVGNLEGTLCDTSTTTRKKGAFNYAFRTPPSFTGRLRDAGYDFLSMANNHAFDFGLPGVRSTERALRRAGISFAGLRGRRRTVVVERRGVRFGLCAFGHNSYTLRHQDLWQVKSVLDSLSRCSDIVVVSFHGGAEGNAMSHLPEGKETYLNEDRGSLRAFARFCIDNGADVIYGHGPHVVRCVEVYKGRFIAYSLGNFCTPYGINTTGIAGYAPVIEIRTDEKGGFIDGQIHSFIQKRGLGPRADTTNVVVRQIKSLTAADIAKPEITIANNGKITLKNK